MSERYCSFLQGIEWRKRGVANVSAVAYSCFMQAALAFDNAPAYDKDGRFVIKSTCRKCGESKLVGIRDRSLAKWESQHTCHVVPKMPMRVGWGVPDG